MATQALLSPKFLIERILCCLYSFEVNFYNQKSRYAWPARGVPPAGGAPRGSTHWATAKLRTIDWPTTDISLMLGAASSCYRDIMW